MKTNARPRRDAIDCYLPRQGDAIRDLARSWGIDLDELEREERQAALAQLHREADDDAYRGPR